MSVPLLVCVTQKVSWPPKTVGQVSCATLLTVPRGYCANEVAENDIHTRARMATKRIRDTRIETSQSVGNLRLRGNGGSCPHAAQRHYFPCLCKKRQDETFCNRLGQPHSIPKSLSRRGHSRVFWKTRFSLMHPPKNYLYSRRRFVGMLRGRSQSFVVALVAMLAVAQTGIPALAQSKTPTPPGDITAIQHIVFIIKENRSFDNYFGQYPNANGATTGVTSYGAVVPLLETPDYAYPFDPEHGWASGNEAIDGGKMDRFDLLAYANINSQGYLGFTQASQSQIPNYWTYAQNFVLADNAFSSIQSDSFTNHLYTVAAQDTGALYITGPTSAGGGSFGCDAPVGTAGVTADAAGNISKVFPCYDIQTLADSLQTAGISWKYYAPPQGQRGYNFSTLDSINHIRNGPLWATNVVNDSTFVNDAATGLPAVSWVVTGGPPSEHIK